MTSQMSEFCFAIALYNMEWEITASYKIEDLYFILLAV